MNRSKVFCVSALLLMATTFRDSYAQQISDEYQLKGAHIISFLHFTEWPTLAFETPQSPLVIGIVGDDPFGVYLDSLVKAENVNQRSVVIERYRNAGAIGVCHLLFIPRSFRRHERQILGKMRNRPVLTVGETERFNEHGGIIELGTADQKITLSVNTTAAKKASLIISSRLLRVATIFCS